MHNKLVSTFLFERNGCSGKKTLCNFVKKGVGFTFPKVEILVPKLVIQAHPVDNGEESFLFLTPAPHPKPLPCWMKSYHKQRTCFFLAFSVFVWIPLYIWVRLICSG